MARVSGGQRWPMALVDRTFWTTSHRSAALYREIVTGHMGFHNETPAVPGWKAAMDDHSRRIACVGFGERGQVGAGGVRGAGPGGGLSRLDVSTGKAFLFLAPPIYPSINFQLSFPG